MTKSQSIYYHRNQKFYIKFSQLLYFSAQYFISSIVFMQMLPFWMSGLLINFRAF